MAPRLRTKAAHRCQLQARPHGHRDRQREWSLRATRTFSLGDLHPLLSTCVFKGLGQIKAQAICTYSLISFRAVNIRILSHTHERDGERRGPGSPRCRRTDAEPWPAEQQRQGPAPLKAHGPRAVHRKGARVAAGAWAACPTGCASEPPTCVRNTQLKGSWSSLHRSRVPLTLPHALSKGPTVRTAWLAAPASCVKTPAGAGASEAHGPPLTSSRPGSRAPETREREPRSSPDTRSGSQDGRLHSPLPTATLSTRRKPFSKMKLNFNPLSRIA